MISRISPSMLIVSLSAWLCLALMSLTLSGCDYWEDADRKEESSSSEDRLGVFVDSPVSGIAYSAETYSGITNAEGQFSYRLDEEISFSIGDIVLGTAKGEALVSPLQLVVGADSVEHASITNMLRFLQTLDADADISNGIHISAAVRNAAKGKTINFHQLVGEFENDLTVLGFIAENTNTSLLVSVDNARQHFSEVISAYNLQPLAAIKHRFKVVRDLDPREQVPFNVNGLPFSSANANSYNYTDSFAIQDSFGFFHTVNLYYVKEPLDTSDPDTSGLPNTWSLYVEVDNAQQVGGTDPDNPIAARFILRFDTAGKLTSDSSLLVSNWTPIYNNSSDSARPLGPDVANPVISDPPASSNFAIDIAAIKFGESEN